MALANKRPKSNAESIEETNRPFKDGFLCENIEGEEQETQLLFGTQEEEEADSRLWEAQFAATPDEKLNKLVEAVQAKIRDSNTSPLDFTNR